MKCIDFLNWIRKSNWKKDIIPNRYRLGIYRTIEYSPYGIRYYIYNDSYRMDRHFAYEELSIDKTGSVMADDGTVIPAM